MFFMWEFPGTLACHRTECRHLGNNLLAHRVPAGAALVVETRWMALDGFPSVGAKKRPFASFCILVINITGDHS